MAELAHVNDLSSFPDWVRGVDAEQRADPLWRVTAYRMAAYASATSWADALALDAVRITRPIAAQLYEAVGAIGSDIAEGYSRSSGLDRARFLEYGLGSTRESTVWYRAGRPVLGAALVTRRLGVLTEIRRLLLAMIPRERTRKVQPRRDRGNKD